VMPTAERATLPLHRYGFTAPAGRGKSVRLAYAPSPAVLHGMAWDVAEDLVRVARSRSKGWHVEARTVWFPGEDSPRRVRVYSVPGMGRIESKRDAERVRYRILGDVRDGRALHDALAWYIPKKLPANLVLQRWEMFCADKALVASTGHLDIERVRELRAYPRRGYFAGWENTSVHELTRGALVGLIRNLRRSAERRQRPLSEKTIKNVLGDVGHFLRWLAREGVIREAPEIPFDELRLVEYQPTIPDVETALRILAEIPVLKRGAWLAKSFMGLRPSEARRLSVSDVRDQGAVIVVPAAKSKMRRGRILEVQHPVREWFAHAEVVAKFGTLEQRFGAAALFPNPETMKHWSETAERRVIEAAMRAAGVTGIRPNEMGRHFFATELANTPGIDFEKVREWLGHTAIGSTRRYGKLRAQTIAKVVSGPRLDHAKISPPSSGSKGRI